MSEINLADKMEKIDLCRKDIDLITKALHKYRDDKTNHFKKCSRWKLFDCPMERVRTIAAHEKKVYDCKFAQHDENCVLSVSNDRKLKYWDVFSGKLLKDFEINYPWVMSCAISASGRLASTTDLKKNCNIYCLNADEAIPKRKSLDKGKRSISEKSALLTKLQGHSDYVSCSSFLSENQLLSGSGDSQLILWDLEKSAETNRYSEHEAGVLCLDVNPAGQTFLSGGYDCYAKLWDTRQASAVSNFSGNESDVNSVKFFPDAMSFLTASDDGTCRLFDIRSFQQLCSYYSENIITPLNSACFSKTGQFIFAISDGGDFITWDVISGDTVEIHKTATRMSCIDTSKGGEAVVTGGWDCCLTIWAEDCYIAKNTVVFDPKG